MLSLLLPFLQLRLLVLPLWQLVTLRTSSPYILASAKPKFGMVMQVGRLVDLNALLYVTNTIRTQEPVERLSPKRHKPNNLHVASSSARVLWRWIWRRRPSAASFSVMNRQLWQIFVWRMLRHCFLGGARLRFSRVRCPRFVFMARTANRLTLSRGGREME